MKLSIISFFGLLVVVLMLVPNVLYALYHRDQKNRCNRKWVILLEQIGRYACMTLMILPLGIGEFGFPSVANFLFYLAANGILLLTYWAGWFQYWHQPDREHALPLAVVPVCIFLFSGLALHHWLLLVAAVLFGIGHILVTLENHKENNPSGQ